MGAGAVARARVLGDRRGPFFGDERDRAAAEAAAGEPGAERARVEQALDERVELRRRDLHVVAQRGVAREHQPPERVDVAVPQRVRELVDPRHLGDDVPGPRMIDDIGRPRVAEDAETEPRGHGFGLGAARGPLAAFERAGDARVHDEHGDARRQRQGLDREIAAVDDERVIGDPRERDELVLDPARHARRVVLGRLAAQGEGRHVGRPVAACPKRERDRNFERRARRRARRSGGSS